MSLATKLGLKAVADAPEKREQLRAAEREYRRAHEPSAASAHQRVDQLVADAQATLEQFITNGKIPDSVHGDLSWRVAVAHVLASDAFATEAHGLIDAAADRGLYDKTPQAEVQARLDAFARERRALDLVQQEAAVELAEAEAAAAREVFTRARQEIDG